MRALFTYNCNKTYTASFKGKTTCSSFPILAFEFTSCCGANLTTANGELACRKCYGKIDEFIYDDVIAFLPFFNEQDAWRMREPYDTPALALIRQAKEFISALDDYVNLKGDYFIDRETGNTWELHNRIESSEPSSERQSSPLSVSSPLSGSEYDRIDHAFYKVALNH